MAADRLRLRAVLIRLAGTVVLATAAPGAGADELKPFQASYEWLWHGMTVAQSNLSLEHSGGHWVYRSRSDPRGLGRMFSERPVQESVIDVTQAGARPLSYKADDGTSSGKHDADLTFDWEHGRVTGVYENTKVDLPLQQDVQDDLSVQIALMVELLAGRTPRQFQIIDRNTVREYTYERDGEQTLDTALGRIPTVVYRSQKAGSPRVTRFWCAPGRGFIPLQVEQKRGTEVQWMMKIVSLQRQ